MGSSFHFWHQFLLLSNRLGCTEIAKCGFSPLGAPLWRHLTSHIAYSNRLFTSFPWIPNTILLKNYFYLKYANSNLWHSVAYLWHFWVPNDLNVLFMPSDDMYSSFPSIWYATSHGYSIILKTVAWRHQKNVMTSQKRIFRKRHLAISSINGFLISFLASVFINI